MIRKCLLLSFLALSACGSVAQPVTEKWPDFGCTSDALVLTFVDLNICTKVGVFSNLQVLGGATPSMVFEQNSRFDVLSYESADNALAGLPKRIDRSGAAKALETLFSWQTHEQLTARQQTLLQVFDITAKTKLMLFNNGSVTAFVRLNADAADNTIFITSQKSENVYRLIGNFNEADAIQWLSYLSPAVKQ